MVMLLFNVAFFFLTFFFYLLLPAYGLNFQAFVLGPVGLVKV